ncbi:MAG: 4-hydroxybenzoate octaprenyltransferase [Paracoccaceae bacterium]
MTQPQGMPEAGIVADAVRGNWVDRIAPPWSRPWLRLSRADRPAGTWLLLIPCYWGIALAANADGFRWHDLWLFLGCSAGAFLMRGAGCTWNDFTDRAFDAQVARTKSRPLPSGQVTPKGALAWMAVQALAAFGILLTFPAAAIWLGVLSLLPVAVYPFAKRFTWWPQVFLGIAFNWGALLAWAAHAGGIGLAPVLMYLAGISWTLFYDTIYAHQDKEDDALIGVKSTARLFAENTHRWLRGFMILSVLLMAAAVLVALLPAGAGLLQLTLALIGVWGWGWHMGWQLLRLDIDDPDICLRLFRSNRDAGLIPALFFAAAALV